MLGSLQLFLFVQHHEHLGKVLAGSVGEVVLVLFKFSCLVCDSWNDAFDVVVVY